jgi:hypothetical protein
VQHEASCWQMLATQVLFVAQSANAWPVQGSPELWQLVD